MPSPFPGMDPYLESDVWTSFQALFASKIVEHLVPKIIPRYLALPEKRYIVIAPGGDEEESRYPDIEVRKSGNGRMSTPASSGVTAPLVMATVMSESVPHTWVEIREAKKRKPVTAIEILSPTNKKGSARQEYLEKREQYLHSSAHLLEIDLVRQGKRPPMRKPLPSVPYFVFLSRAGQRPLTEVWPIGWEDPLPEVPVPLLKGDQDVTLALQKVVDDVFQASAIDLSIDYTQPPDVALPKEVQDWTEKVVRATRRKKA